MRHTLIASIAVGLLFACSDAQAHPPLFSTSQYAPSPEVYSFAPGDLAVVRLSEAFRPPEGFLRVDVGAGSFGGWLRGLPMRADRTRVKSYRGDDLDSPSAGIIPLDLGDKNLQQCADSAIRLHAEWLWASGRHDDLAYHFTSGDEIRFSDWLRGERIAVDGANVRRLKGEARARSRASLRSWLDLVFMYAGTRSLARDSRAVEPTDVQPGDFFVAPGSPGHAVVVLDVATNDAGRRVALLGQGFMPAQEFHVLRSQGRQVLDEVWFVLPQKAEEELRTPSWRPFSGADARRFTAP